MKQIKTSKRGLTFSFEENENFPIGGHFTYVVDVKGGTVLLLPDKTGKNTVSKKKVGMHVKSLIDLRAKQVREFLEDAELLEIEECEEGILVTAIAVTKVRSGVISLAEVRKQKSILISNSILAQAAGSECSEIFSYRKYKKLYTVLSLFSGAGMLDLPFVESGRFRIVYAMDYDKAAVASYKENIGYAEHADIRSLNEAQLPQADVVIGGPSCKPFSNANRHKRLKEHDDFDLFREYMRIVKGVNPYIFAMENVPGFISAGNNLDEMRKILTEYNISYRIYCDADLGGYTTRKRLILCGSRLGRALVFPDIKRTVYKTAREALGKVDSTWFNYHDYSKPKEKTLERIKLIPQGKNHEVLPDSMKTKSVHSGMLRRLKLDRPSVSLPNIRKACILHPTENRILSVAECLALSGFGKSFKILGQLAERQQQVANGVPYSYGQFLAGLITDELDRHFRKLDFA